MNIYGQFVVPEFNLKRYTVAAGKKLDESFREGIRIWLTAVTGRVPLWSGMARASLLNVAKLVNGKVVLGPLQAKSRIPQGESLGTATLTTNFPIYHFEFSTDVAHYVIQEDRNVRATTGRGSPSAPWHSLVAGRQAFEAFSRTLKVPKITFLTRVVRIK